ncbi:G8 domain-containing protein, partial [Roseobacter sp. EG26]|uniref:G8 domain-containing protein n=1 Tax=Roseobacter sp. EG26 TaxID=3412477 RepID=UPI003CE49E99
GGHDPIELPKTAAEVEAFVAAVRASPETHTHDAGSSKMGEHMAVLDLVPRAEATHIAIGNGDWDDPANWHNGEVPGDDAQALIPEGVHMTYDHVSDDRLFTVRVDGHLDFATDVDSQLVVDTVVISPSGTLTIGTETDPVDPDVNVDIIFANNGAIDTDWDPMLLSRGMVAHGTVEIHGAEKDSHEKVIDDPQAGDTWLDFGETPEGWAVGDTIVIAGTNYEGYINWDPRVGYSPSEDEERVITQIEDGQVFFDTPLEFDHDTPRDDLKTSVANYTRNISFETENAESAEVYERGHVMFMHNDDVDVRYAEFHELGRTDKSETALNTSEFDQIDFDTNVKGRYAFHFHRAGVDDPDDPGIATGNAVYGSPGWGFVHHDSNAILDNNASFNTHGAGYVAESGNETGAWTNNIAILAKGNSWHDPKIGNDLDNFDLGSTGDGFWFQGRMVESSDNIAASVNTGFVYFHRGGFGETENIKFDADTSVISGALSYADKVFPDEHPILGFNGNEAFASKAGLYVLKAETSQSHDVHSVLEDFTAWNVRVGAELSYTSHYTLKDFDLIGKGGEGAGILLGTNATDITIADSEVTDFYVGMDLFKKFTIGASPEAHEYTIVNSTVSNATIDYHNYDPSLDTILSTGDLPLLDPDVVLDGPLTYKEGDPSVDPDARTIKISGTKKDSLGETEFSSEVDDYSVGWLDTLSLLNTDGYYSTSDGDNYFLMDIYFSDRLTGDIYIEKHPVFLDDNVAVGQDGHWAYGNVPFNGVQDLGGSDDPTFDAAKLW